MYLAEMDSEHYSWHAVGGTEAEARLAIARGFTRHLIASCPGETTAEAVLENWAAEVGADEPPTVGLEDFYVPEWFAKALDEYYGVNVVEVEPGECYRDLARI